MIIKNGKPHEQQWRVHHAQRKEKQKLLSRKPRRPIHEMPEHSRKTSMPMGIKSLMTYAFGDIAKNGVSIMMNMIKARVLYTVIIDDLRHQIEPWIFCRHFKNIPVEETYVTYTAVDEVGSMKNKRMTTHDGIYADFTTFRGVTIGIVLEVSDDKERKYDPSISLCCLNTKHSIDTLNEFIKCLVKETIHEREKRGREYAQTNSTKYSNSWMSVKIDKRSFDNVFITSDTQELLTSSINSFIEKKEWYEDHRIPYHFGILLHGVGGTGKSSIIKAICSEFDVDPYLIKGMELDEMFTMLTYRDFRNKPAVVIVEDIDTYEFTNNRHASSNKYVRENDDDDEIEGAQITRKGKLGQLLNFMDGFNSPSNVIYVFTTNHIEDLDAALIRPGRIDLCIEIGYIVDETMDKFLMFHYEKHLPEDKHMKPEFTFAELQTDVMRGLSFDEMIAKYTYERGNI